MTTLQPMQSKATMEEAWAEADRLWAEGDRLWAERELVVILTAQALYGKDVQIDWEKRTARAYQGKE